MQYALHTKLQQYSNCLTIIVLAEEFVARAAFFLPTHNNAMHFSAIFFYNVGGWHRSSANLTLNIWGKAQQCTRENVKILKKNGGSLSKHKRTLCNPHESEWVQKSHHTMRLLMTSFHTEFKLPTHSHQQPFFSPWQKVSTYREKAEKEFLYV